jgi:hypothetical protein
MNETPRPRKRHELKCWPKFFEPTLRGIKRFELRRDDRGGFQVGDELLLQEWNPEMSYGHRGEACEPHYTGREVLVRVDYVMGQKEVRAIMNLLVIMPGYVIMSVSRVE